MSAFTQLFGDTLLSGTEDVKTSAALEECEAVAIYFSAHWCGPCRKFTPKLIESYKSMTEAGKRFQVVFVSGDNDENSFKEYYKDMPWLALPFESKEINAKLNSLYKVRGIPSLIILDKDGQVITTNGRSKITSDPKGDEFPWPKKSVAQLLGTEFVKGDEKVGKEAIDGKHVALYFSAHWCPPCKRFTPIFTQVYNKLKAANKDFEVVFVSSDQDEEQFKEYYETMPWLALPFEKRAEKAALSEHFEVNGIPSLFILDPDLNVINSSGVGAIYSDREGENFPWLPALVPNLDEATELFEEAVMVIAMIEGCDDDKIKSIKESFNAAAQATRDAAKANNKDEKVRFAIAGKSSDIAPRLRSFTNMGEASAKEQIILLDGNKFFLAEDADATKVDSLTSLANKVIEGKVQFKSL